MCGWIVAAECHPDPEQKDDQPEVARAERKQHQEKDKDHHLGDEHISAAKTVRQAAQSDRTDQNPQQAGGADNAMLGGGDVELLGDQRHRDTRHEDDKALEELAGGRKPPDAPLHRGHQARRQRGAVRPHRRLVDVVLNRPPA